MRIGTFLGRLMQALSASREREAERVLRRHAHLFEQAADYERSRAIERARRAADAKAITDAKVTIAQAGLQLAP